MKDKDEIFESFDDEENGIDLFGDDLDFDSEDFTDDDTKACATCLMILYQYAFRRSMWRSSDRRTASICFLIWTNTSSQSI